MLQDLVRFYREATGMRCPGLGGHRSATISRGRLRRRLPRRSSAADGRGDLVGALREILSYPAAAFHALPIITACSI
jgi:hypothetical protein